MLVPEKQLLFFAQEKREKNGQVNARLDESTNVKLTFKSLNCSFLHDELASILLVAD